MSGIADITGKTYHKLTVIKPSHKNQENRWIWECVCECGNICYAAKNQLDHGMNKTCGKCERPKPNLQHGGKFTDEYKTWSSIRNRCNNPNSKDFPRYGGRGIKIDSEWEDFSVFLKDMGKRPSKRHQIDRIDTNGPYAKSNCRWATASENAKNRRTSKLWIINGRTFGSIMDAAHSFSVTPQTIHKWCYGWFDGRRNKQNCAKPGCFTQPKYANS
ncbi:MAG: hypothetical protein LLG20_22760 [Acidobacteriales bacterium]|nr:hypothetical protein [Terriglobales bacterium]